MAKRKRNDFDSSPSSSSSGWSRGDSLSPSPSHHAFDFRFPSSFEQQMSGPQAAWPRAEDEWHNASGRTLKRFRDNRPDEQAIYANTFRKLFEAQRSQAQQQQPLLTKESLVPPTTMPDAMDTSDASAQAQDETTFQQQPKSQSSLHKFFNISRAPISNAMPAAQPAFDGSPRCQDCEASLRSSGDDMMMDDACDTLDVVWSCGRCGRAVCDLCAVVNIGAGRECLTCRTG